MTAWPAAADYPSLLDLVEARRWHRLQDHFAKVLGIPLRTTDLSHALLVAPSWPPGIAAEQAIELLKVGEELESLLPAANPPHTTTSVTTSLGVTYAAIPIHATPERMIAYFIVGPMVVGPREDKAQFRRRVSAMGHDAQAIWNLILSLKLYTFSGIRSLLNLLEEVGTSLVQFAYQANQLTTILPATDKMDHAVVTYYTDRVLNSLLDVATMATRAEGGSVMLYEGQGDVMKIRAAHGLSDAVVAKTSQKRGEGIAGLAASKRSILLLDDETADRAMSPFMRRKELVSSIVAPLSVDPEQEPIGVVSLRTTNRDRRFTPEHVEMLRRLLDLTGIALGNLRSAFTKPSASS